MVRQTRKKRSAGAVAPRLKFSAAAKKVQPKVRLSVAEKPFPEHKGITVMLDGEPYDGYQDSFCSRCHDGDVSRGCDFCPRSFCRKCVIPAANQPAPDMFKCPCCHFFGAGEKGKVNKEPYANGFFFIGELSTRENWARCRSDPLAIISFRLKGMPLSGSAAVLIYHQLFGYLLGNVALVDFEFCLDSDDGFATLTSNLLEMADEFNSGRLQRFRNGRFLVILTDHSSPDTGDVHTAPNNASATTLEELFNFFLEGGLGGVLKGGQQNTLVIQSCGGVVAHPEPIAYLKQLTTPPDDEKAIFFQAIAFSQQNLQLSFTSRFLCHYSQNLFIHDKAHVGATIFEHQSLGPHTDVIWFKAGQRTRFFWAHPALRPHGKTAPTICQGCQRFMPWVDADAKKRKLGQIKNHRQEIVHTCEHCNVTLRYPFPDGAKWVRNHGYDGTERGSWLSQLLDS